MTAMASPAPAAARSRANPLSRILRSDWLGLWLAAATFAALLPALPALGSSARLAAILAEAWPLLIVALGQSFVMAAGGIDLSQGAVIGLASTLGAALIATAGPPGLLSSAPAWGLLLGEQGGALAGQVWLGVLAMLVAGALAGLVNGMLVAWLAVPSYMATLLSLVALGALAAWLTASGDVRDLPDAYLSLGRGELLSIHLGPREEAPIPRSQLHGLLGQAAVIAIAVALALHLLLGRTAFGAQLLAVGASREAARIAGVPVRRVILLAFVLSSLCAALGAVLLSARLGAGGPSLGDGLLLPAIGAAAIGGASALGGRGRVIRTVSGVALFALLAGVIDLLDLPRAQAGMATGAAVLAAVLLGLGRARLEGGPA